MTANRIGEGLMAETEQEHTVNTIAEPDGQKRTGSSQTADQAGGKDQKPAKRKKAGDGQSQKRVKKSSAGSAGRGTAKQGNGKKKAAKGRKKQKTTTQTMAKSFGHAFDGILAGLEERNMKIHCTMAALVVFFGLILHISVTEWCICLVLFGLIMGLELVNTSLEALCDLVTKEYHPLAKRAKDTAAGAVLIASIMAAAAGLIIFIPRLLYMFKSI